MSLRNLIFLPFVLLTIALLGSCGSSTLPKSNPQGFSVSSLSGSYVFSSIGADSNGNFLTMAGALVANGSGSITGGTMDVIDSGFTPAAPVAQPITSGSYTVGTDGRGRVTLTSSVGTITLEFVLIPGSAGPSSVSPHGLISEFDSNGTGSGTLDLQTAITSQGQLAGPYALSLGGIDSNFDNFASTGAFAIDTTGTMTGGVEDFNAGGTIYAAQTLTGSAIIGSGTAPGSITLTTPSFPLTFDFYPIDTTHWKLIETDFTEILAGDVFTQTGASIPTGPMVFSMSGGTTGPIAVGGLMISSGDGNFTGGLEDVNNAGTLSPAQVPFSGSPASPFGFGGRAIINLTGFDPAIQWVVYPTLNGGLLMMETDGLNVMEGNGYLQSATSFSAGSSVGYGFNLTGASPVSLVDDIAQFNASTGTSNNIAGVLGENDQGSLVLNLRLSGTYTPDSPASGRGSLLVPSLGTPLGGLSLEYYVVDSSTVIFIEADTQQVGVGTFEMQGSVQSGAQSHFITWAARASARGGSKLRRK